MALSLAASSLLWSAACASPPKVGALAGQPTTVGLPRTAVPPGHSRLVFRWDFKDRLFGARGEGVARIAWPDSVRLDFFADGNLGGGFAILIGDSLFTPADGNARRYLPPVPVLWAAMGRLTIVARDTLLRLDGDTLRAELVGSVPWRAGFVRGELVAISRIEGGRLQESVARDSSGIVYRHYGARRRLVLTVVRRLEDPPFDEAIWHH